MYINIGFKYIIKMSHKDVLLTAELKNNFRVKIGDVKQFYILKD